MKTYHVTVENWNTGKEKKIVVIAADEWDAMAAAETKNWKPVQVSQK